MTNAEKLSGSPFNYSSEDILVIEELGTAEEILKSGHRWSFLRPTAPGRREGMLRSELEEV